MQEIPYGYCHCGCGRRTSLARQTRTDLGHVKGEPVAYVRGHSGPARPYYIVDDDTGCWLWQRCKTDKGYGYLKHEGRPCRAHRVYYEQARGPIPDGLQLDHLCRNPPCVNPDHLEVVTPAENTRRGRVAKLTDEQVREIRASPLSSRQVAPLYGIHHSYVSALRTGRWRKAA